MKKILCFIITISLIMTSASVAYAKQNKEGKQNKQQKTEEQQKTEKQKKDQQKKDHKETNQQHEDQQETSQQESKHQEEESTDSNIKDKKQSFKIDGSPVIKYGRYKLPIRPITQGIGADVGFDKQTAILTVTKDTTTIIINFKKETVTVNGIADTDSGIFSANNDKKVVVLIQYIAKTLGVRANVDDDEVIVVTPGFDLPTGVTVTPVGTNTVVNTLNSTTLYLIATANMKAGQATGGKAELYVGSKLIATDSVITATDTMVTFTTGDGSSSNAKLQSLIPTGGVVSVKLYNAQNQCVTSTAANPTLMVDYAAPTITGITYAIYNVPGNAINITVTGAGAVNDKVDVTKILLTDTFSGRTYRLTSGSTGIVSSSTNLMINLCAADVLGLTGFGNSTVYLTVSTDPLLTDLAGNKSAGFTSTLSLPVVVIH